MADVLMCCKDLALAKIKAGDVVAVKDDGHQWGECEMGGRRADPQNFPADMAASIGKGGIIQGELVFTQAKSSGVQRDSILASGVLAGLAIGKTLVAPPVEVYANRVVDQRGKQVVSVLPISEHPNGNHPFFRIFHLPNVSVAALGNLVVPMLSANKPVAGTLQAIVGYRAFYFDASKVTDPAVLAFWNDDTRADGSYVWAVTEKDWPNYVSQRPQADA